MNKLTATFILATHLLSSSAYASTPNNVVTNGEQRVRNAVVKLVGKGDIEGIVIQAIDPDSLYRVTLSDNRTAQVGLVGDKVMIGEVYLESTMQTLQDAQLSETLRHVVDSIPDEDFIVFGPEDPKRTVTVFTDLDCGYCRRLHQNIRAIIEAGIKVRYAPFPRSGPDTDSFKKMEMVYCSNDRKSALTTAKEGGSLDVGVCDNPVQKHVQAASAAGVSYTPTVFTDDGRLINGFPGVDEFIKTVLQEQ